MSYGQFRVLTEEEKQLCRASNVIPEGMTVILENENTLRLLHHKSGNTVSIYKGEAEKRRKMRGNQ